MPFKWGLGLIHFWLRFKTGFTSDMTMDKPLIGIVLMLGFCILAPIGDAIAKMLGTSVPLAEVVLIRFAVQLVVLAPIVGATDRSWYMRGALFWLTLLRTVLLIIGIAAMFTALRFLPWPMPLRLSLSCRFSC